jgi:hypothetical protein
VVSDDQTPGPAPASAQPTSAVPASGDPGSATPSPAAPAAAPAGRRPGRRALLIVAIAVVFLVLLGGAIGVVAYDKATAIDRSTPGVATQQFLQAALVDRDPGRVGLFICVRWSVADAMRATALVSVPGLNVNWGIIAQTQNEGNATTDVRVRISVPGNGGVFYREVQPWHITLVNEGGWRVCRVEIGPSINE